MKKSIPCESPIAVIAFSDDRSPLEPLWPGTHRALLPIAGKPVIVSLIEQLADAGIRHVRIGNSIQQIAVQQRLKAGTEWGITVRYSDLRGQELLTESLANNGQCLYLQGDSFYDADFSKLEVFEDTSGSLSLGNVDSGWWRMTVDGPEGFRLDDALSSSVYDNRLRTAADYYRANIDAMSGDLKFMTLSGAPFHRDAMIDWHSSVASTSFVGGGVFIGKQCRLGELTRLSQNCFLSNGVVVDDGADLENVVVLPNCFIGAGQKIRNGIVGAHGVMHLNGQYESVANPSVLAPSRQNLSALTGIPEDLVLSCH